MPEETTQCRMCLDFFDPHSVHITIQLHDEFGLNTADLMFCRDCSEEIAEKLPADVKENILRN